MSTDPRRHLIAGDWRPLDAGGSPAAVRGLLDAAVDAATRGARVMRELAAAERATWLLAIGEAMAARAEALAEAISREVGKPISEARAEAGRIRGIFRLAAGELVRPTGEVLALDAMPGGAGRLGFTLRQPCGVVLAITPFNYPLLLVAHKVAPALAGGNAVILKPASLTSETAFLFAEVIAGSGGPPEAFQLILGSGDEVGLPLARDPRIRRISFTGSTEVGDALVRAAGIKRLSLELGGNAPVIVCPDADLDEAARSIAVGGYSNAGQACISPQRVIVPGGVSDRFVQQLVDRVESIRIGDRTDPETQLAGVVTPGAADRLDKVFSDAVSQGAAVLTGGQRLDEVTIAPAVVDGVRPGMRLFDEELFGPAVGVVRVRDLDEAVAVANATPYGLSAAVFTREITTALRFVKALDFGNVMINWSPLWRSDLAPYGGLKSSGFGKEGIRYAIDEMTESKAVVVHGLDG